MPVYPAIACNACNERRVHVGPLRMCTTCDGLEPPRGEASWATHATNDHTAPDRIGHSCAGCEPKEPTA